MAKTDVRKISYGLIKILYRSFIAAKKCCALMIRFICKSILPNLIPFLYDKLCIKYLWEIFHPPAINSIKKPPSRLLIMALVVYTSFYGFASIRYEQAISRLENRVNNIYYQSEGAGWKTFFSKIPEVQNTKIPHRPMLSDPITVFYSLWPSNDHLDADVIRDMQDLVNSKKSNLNDMVLNYLILHDVDKIKAKTQSVKSMYDILGIGYNLGIKNFTYSNFTNSWLKNAMLSSTDFQYSKFNHAIMRGAQLKSCNLSYTSFIEADLTMSTLKNANLYKADLQYTDLYLANIEDAILVGANLYNSHSLNSVRLKGACYNSKAIELQGNIQGEYIVKLCSKYERKQDSITSILYEYLAKSPHSYIFTGEPTPKEHAWLQKHLLKSNTNHTIVDATIFPDGFNPKEHGMLDASDAKDLEKYIEMQAKNQAHKFTDN